MSRVLKKKSCSSHTPCRSLVANTVETFATATAANRSTACRRGNLIHLDATSADDLIISSDLHGHRINFDNIVAAADLANHTRRHLVLQEVCHGGPTYPSGDGCMSHLLLEDVAALKAEFPDRVHFILSNHELAELTDFPIIKGGRMLNLMFRCGIQEMYGTATERVKEAYSDFLASLPLGVRLGPVLITHSLPEETDLRGFDAEVFSRPYREEDLSDGGIIYRLVWGRDYRAENARAFCEATGANLLITGHEPCSRGVNTPSDRHVIVDSCCHHACYVHLPAELPNSLCPQDVLQRVIRLD